MPRKKGRKLTESTKSPRAKLDSSYKGVSPYAVKGPGGGVKRRKAKQLSPASKSQIKKARKLNQAKGRNYRR